MLRIIAVLGVALSLSACAMVSSERPLFSAADSDGAPILRPGLWAAVEPDCKFNPRSPAAAWPACVAAMIVGASTLVEVQRETKETSAAPVQTYRLVAGDPVVAQIQTPPESAAVYFGLRPMASDGDGRITKVRIWFAACEKPTPNDGAPRPRQLPPDLHPIKGQPGCLARTQAAVRNAVRQSEAGDLAVGKGPAIIRWIRDGDR